MRQRITNRRGFQGANEPLVVITLLFVAIALALPMLQRLTSAGWAWWSASLIVLVTFLMLIAYSLGVFYGIFVIARIIVRLLKRSAASSEPWCGLIAGSTTLFIALPVYFILVAMVTKRLAP
jgi:hypothetical protein